MSSRGAVAKFGYVTTKDYNILRVTESGVKILVGIGNNHSLPELAHTPNSIYAKLKKDGKTLHELRFFDEKGYPIFEIAYHPEPAINNGDRQGNILHYHTFTGLDRDDAIKMDEFIKEKYKKFLEEFDLYD